MRHGARCGHSDSSDRVVADRGVYALGLGGSTRIFRRAATRLGPAAQNGSFSLLFCDPPYGRNLAGPALTSAAEGGWLEPGALAVVEERVGAFQLPARFEELERRATGESELTFARFLPA